MHPKLNWTVGSIYALSLLGAVLAPPNHAADTTAAQPRPPATTSDAQPAPTARRPIPQPLIAFALNLHHTDQLPRYFQAIDDIAALGANAVEIITPVFQTNGADDSVRLQAGPGRGPETWQLIALLNHAHQRGLTTLLMPQVLFTAPRGNEWRGKIQPERWQPWWDSYRQIIDHFLDVADQAPVDVLCVGSELLTTETQPDRWGGLIAHARTRFNGLLTYSTNWDHYPTPSFWDQLDLISVSSYWDITTLADDPQHPDPHALAQRWAQIRDKLLEFAQAQNRPILLTELGYPCLPWALKDPWNYINPDNLPADPQAQFLGYQAFLTAWNDLLQPLPDPIASPKVNPNPDRPADNPPHHFAGVCFYHWDPYHDGGPQDTGYGVKGKPAHTLIEHWLTPRQPAPPATP